MVFYIHAVGDSTTSVNIHREMICSIVGVIYPQIQKYMIMKEVLNILKKILANANNPATIRFYTF